MNCISITERDLFELISRKLGTGDRDLIVEEIKRHTPSELEELIKGE